jgi:hypothetical protein
VWWQGKLPVWPNVRRCGLDLGSLRVRRELCTIRRLLLAVPPLYLHHRQPLYFPSPFSLPFPIAFPRQHYHLPAERAVRRHTQLPQQRQDCGAVQGRSVGPLREWLKVHPLQLHLLAVQDRDQQPSYCTLSVPQPPPLSHSHSQPHPHRHLAHSKDHPLLGLLQAQLRVA